jgi:PAS domain S-box-containing protein
MTKNPTYKELVQNVIELEKKLRELKQTEEVLQESEERFRALTENATDITLILNYESIFKYVSPSVKKIFGYSPDELIGETVSRLVHPEDLPRIHERIERAIQSPGETIEVGYFRSQRKNGSHIYLAGSATCLYELAGVDGIVANLRDVTDQVLASMLMKKATEATEAANRAKSEFLANMSHELRTPLNHIIGFTELVVDKHFGDLNEIQMEYLNDSLKSSKHLLSLINDILTISKVEAGKLDFKPSDVNLKPLLENSLTMIEEKAVEHSIQLSLGIDGIPETIKADKGKLKHIMYNLLSNALKFTPDGGEIRLEAKMRGSSIEFTVTDTGIGLNLEDLEEIFNPFDQVDNSKGRTNQGAGLGLSLTKSLVELHRGKIWAESEGEGKGSTFRFAIPVFDQLRC